MQQWGLTINGQRLRVLFHHPNDPERLCVFGPANAVNLSGWQITFRSVEHFFFVRIANTFADAELGKAPGQTIPVRFVKAPEL